MTATLNAQDWAPCLARMARGNRAALAEFYDATSTMAYSLALRITGNVAAAEQILTGAYTEIWQAAARFDTDRGSAPSWLVSIVRRRALEWRRKHTTNPEPRGATVLEMLFYDGLTIAEVAATTGRSAELLRRELHQTMSALRNTATA
jgi:DNA-directed RNA polymerase specialized sigma24 family protein